jgi:lipoate---protein ligase
MNHSQEEPFEILLDVPGEARFHMDVDRSFIASGSPHPLLRIYDWSRPAITAGLFSDPETLLDRGQCYALGLEIVKRPTGGGILFHDTDMVCAVFVPGASMTRSLCEVVNAKLRSALAFFLPPPCPSLPAQTAAEDGFFCMAHAAPSDLFWNGKKIGGCAQRRSRFGILQQISIFLHAPKWERIAPCLKRQDDLYAMQSSSTSLDEIAYKSIDRGAIKEAIAEQFKEGFP